ncbi:MAG: acyltransferase [Pseudobutyrivibrio sp.]|nr:acyltransferase [Pseudobutyrivibrio sp.]MCF0185532.1 acyltransferase [Bacteroidaceae bacterium]
MKKRLYGLDYLRIVAALIIYWYHFTIFIGGVSLGNVINRLTYTGNVVMTLFFIISGFALYYNYSDRDYSELSVLKDFFKRRFVSIFPLYFISVLLWFITSRHMLSITEVLVLIPLGLTMTPTAMFGCNGFSFGGYLWFMSAMLFCYLAFPYLSMIITKMDNRSRVAMLSVLYVLLCSGSLTQQFTFGEATSAYGSQVFRMMEFATGMIICAFYKDDKIKLKRPDLAFVISIIVTLSARYIAVVLNDVSVYISDFYLLPIYGVLIFCAASLDEGSMLYKAAAARPVQYFSKLTFGIYIMQQWTFIFYNKALDSFAGGTGWFADRVLRSHSTIKIAACCLVLAMIATWMSDRVKKRLL